MLCTHCNKEKATLFYTQNINGKESSAALCSACAKKAGIGNVSILSPMFKSAPKTPSAQSNAKRCNLCGLQWRDILAMGKVGCPTCYNTFREELQETIRSIHGGAKHYGKAPDLTAAPEKAPSEEEKLRTELAKAIETENYEEAARIRDALKALKGENT